MFDEYEREKIQINLKCNITFLKEKIRLYDELFENSNKMSIEKLIKTQDEVENNLKNFEQKIKEVNKKYLQDTKFLYDLQKEFTDKKEYYDLDFKKLLEEFKL
jgi:flagellar motility protein MotE (MotC chaperone)